jgi:hypothetical protein
MFKFVSNYQHEDISIKPQWEGVVRIDSSLESYVSDIQNYDGYKILVIKDVQYHNSSYDTPDNIMSIGRIYFPDTITIIVYGKEIHQYMKCTVFYGYTKIEKTRGLIRKETYFEERLVAKGFTLEPISIEVNQKDAPFLGSYRAKMGADNAFEVKEKGMALFCSGSDSSGSSDSAYRSITCVFVVSDSKPFVAFARRKGQIFTVNVNSSGLKEESENKQTIIQKTRPKQKEDPLEVLKLRLAKGEITKEEYEDLKKTLEQ